MKMMICAVSLHNHHFTHTCYELKEYINEKTVNSILRLIAAHCQLCKNKVISSVRFFCRYGEYQSGNLADLGADAPVASLEAIIAFNKQDMDNRAPYRQDHLEASLSSKLTDEEFNQMVADNQQTARQGIDGLLAQYDVDVIVSDFGQLYAPAGYPTLTVPSGYAEDGTPQGVVFVGAFLSEPQLLAVGFAYEQATQARVVPNLEATMQLIDEIEKK